MKSPWTSQPASLRSSAATAESTPPERPTIARAPGGGSAGCGESIVVLYGPRPVGARAMSELDGRDLGCRACRGARPERSRAWQIELGDAAEVLAASRQIVANAPLHQRTAELRLPKIELRGCQPVSADDAVVERARGIMVADHAREREAQDGAIARGVVPEVNAEQGVRAEMPGGLFARFPHDRGEQSLTKLDVARGLIEQQPPVDPLLDQEEPSGDFRDGGDGNVRCDLHGRHCNCRR